MRSIQRELNFKDYLGDELFNIYCNYRREDVYQNSNFTSKGLNNAQLFERAKEFLDAARKELSKATIPQYTVSATLNNFLLIEEFSPIVDKLVLGNWIRIGVEDDIFRLRLIECETDISVDQALSLTFSDVTKYEDVVSDFNDLIDDVKSMATSWDYYAVQATEGYVTGKTMKDWIDNGLKAANNRIMNNTSEEVMIDSNGITARTLDDINENYNPRQLRITHNIIAFTENNWRTTATAIGDIDYYNPVTRTNVNTYGVLAQAVIAGHIQGCTIVGSSFYGVNSTTGALNGFSVDNGGNIKGATITGSSFTSTNGAFSVTTDGQLTATNASITGNISGSSISGGTISGSAISGATITGSSFSSTNGAFSVDVNGVLNATNANITGNISGSTIKGGSININDIFIVESNGVMTANNSQLNFIGSEGSLYFEDPGSTGWMHFNGNALIGGYYSDGQGKDGTVMVNELDLAIRFNSKTSAIIAGRYYLGLYGGDIVVAKLVDDNPQPQLYLGYTGTIGTARYVNGICVGTIY